MESIVSLVSVGLLIALAWSDARAQLAVRARALPKPRTAGDRRCPFCHEAVDGDVVVCAACSAEHHRDCWTAHGACSIHGCVSRAHVALRARGAA